MSATHFVCPEVIDFGGVMTPIDEAVLLVKMTCGKATEEEKVDFAARWLERKLRIGRFAGMDAVEGQAA